MTLTEPRPLADVVSRFDAKTPIGSVLRTAEWEKLPQGLRDRAMFSAGVESVRWLSKAQDDLGEILKRSRAVNERGQEYWATDRSKIVADLRKMGRDLGIEHPDARRDAGGKVNEQDLTDPLSIRRLKLIVNTQMEMAYGYGDFLAAHDPAVLDVWPCWELVRISPRAVPRDWQRRWVEAGAALHDGRMIARKDSPVWVGISRFGNPYPPFDFGSGMGVEDVTREEAVSLGVIQEADVVESQVQPFNAGLEASVKGMSAKEKVWLKQIFGNQVKVVGDSVKWNESGAAPPKAPKPPKKKPAATPHAVPAPEFPENSAALGVPVSTFAEIKSGVKGVGREFMLDALRTIDSVHGDGALDKLPFHHGVHGNDMGYYHGGKFIAVRKGLMDGHFQMTQAHEVGHWIDHKAFAGPGFSSRAAATPGHPMHAWWQAVAASPQYTELLNRPADTTKQAEYREYQLRPQELWARSYAQFIVEASGHKSMNAHLGNVLAGSSAYWPESQWGSADFAPIKKAIKELIVAQGWMK